MDFIDNHQTDLPDIVSGLPTTRDTVPLFRSSDDDVGVSDRPRIGCVVTSQLNQFQSHRYRKPLLPVLNSFANKGFHWCNINHLRTRLGFECPPHGQFCSDCLTTTGWRPQKNIGWCVIEQVKNLGLHRVEKLEPLPIELFENRIVQGRNRQWLKIEQICVYTLRVRTDQVLEGDWRHRLCAQPSIRNRTNIDLTWQWVRQRNGEIELMVVVELLPAHDKIFMVVYFRRFRILNPDPIGFGSSMVSIVPRKFRVEA